MINRIHPFKIILPVLIALVSVSCSTTRMTAVWQDDTYTAGALKKVMVKGVTENLRDSRLLEDTFVRQLIENGIEAFASTRMTPEVPAEIQRELIAEAQQRQTDALLSVRLVGVIKKTVYHPPRPYFAPISMSLGYCDSRYLSYHFSSHFMMYEPGYYTEHPFFQIESNLYDTQTSQLIWSAASETFEPASINALVESVSEVVIKNLRAAQLLPQ